jgi:hypothetical protein
MVEKEAPFVLLKRPSRRVAFGDPPQDEVAAFRKKVMEVRASP